MYAYIWSEQLFHTSSLTEILSVIIKVAIEGDIFFALVFMTGIVSGLIVCVRFL